MTWLLELVKSTNKKVKKTGTRCKVSIFENNKYPSERFGQMDSLLEASNLHMQHMQFLVGFHLDLLKHTNNFKLSENNYLDLSFHVR